MNILILLLGLFQFDANADIMQDLQQISDRNVYSLTVLADRSTPRTAVYEIFGPANDSCASMVHFAQFISGVKSKNCNSNYDEVRAKRSVIFAAHLLQKNGIKKTYSHENFEKLSQKSIEIYESDFKFFNEQ